MSLKKPIETVASEDLLSLISSGFRDARVIAFKRDLPRSTDAGRQDFLREVASFANAQGGHIIYGVTARDGAATALSGLEPSAVESALPWLESAVTTGVDPLVIGVRFRVVNVADQKCVLVVRVPRTWAGPHLVTFNECHRFYSRNSAGGCLLDLNELRTAFALGDEAGRRMRAFRLDRVSAIINGELSVHLSAAPKTVLHILPLASFQPGFRVDLERTLENEAKALRPMQGLGLVTHYNYEGLIAFSSMEKYAYSYVQVFRNGCLEAGESLLLDPKDGRKFFPSTAFEREVVQCGEGLLELLRRLEVPGPRVVMLTFLGVRGYSMFVSSMRWHANVHQVTRDNLFLDEVIMDEGAGNFARAMRPVFDQVWNTCGWAKSLNYGEDGNWRAYE